MMIKTQLFYVWGLLGEGHRQEIGFHLRATAGTAIAETVFSFSRVLGCLRRSWRLVYFGAALSASA
jgi:hypothetical protein